MTKPWWNRSAYNRGVSYYGGYFTRRKTVNEFKSEVEGTTPTLGRKKVTVYFSGKEAGIQGDSTIVFPNLGPTEELDNGDIDVFRGFVDTKSSLLRFSDMDFYKGTLKSLKDDDPMLVNIFTAIEEARVAREYCHDYVGAKRNVGSLVKKVANLALGKGDGKTKNHLYGPALATCVMDRLGGAYTWLEQKAMEDEGLDMDAMRKYADIVFDLETTQESFDLARKIYEEVEKDDEDEDDNDGNGGGDDGEEGNEEGNKDDNKYVNSNDVINDITENFFRAPRDGNDQPYRVPTTDYDVTLHWASDGHRFDKNIARYNKVMDELSSSVSTLKRKIELLIQSTRKIDWDRRKEYGRFDSRRLIGAYNAEPDVFKLRDDRSDLDTAISIVVDMSGSMGGGKSVKAMQTCGLLAECMQKIGVPFEIVGFSTGGPIPQREIKQSRPFPEAAFSRYDKLELYEFKRFSDRWFDARHYMGNMYHSGPECRKYHAKIERENDDKGVKNHGVLGFRKNIDGESVSLASTRLMKRPEKRKVMFVLSDGQPAAMSENSFSLHEHLEDTIKRVSKQHDIVGIGIEDSSVRHYYPNYVVLKRAEDLPQMGLRLLEDAILNKQNYIKDENKLEADGVEND